MKKPTTAQLRVLEAMRDGAELSRFDHPNHRSWDLRNVSPLNATRRVRVDVVTAIRRNLWIESKGNPERIGAATRQPYTLTTLGYAALAKAEGKS